MIRPSSNKDSPVTTSLKIASELFVGYYSTNNGIFVCCGPQINLSRLHHYLKLTLMEFGLKLFDHNSLGFLTHEESTSQQPI